MSSKQYHSVEEIMKLYNNKDALEIIKDMMEKEVVRVLKHDNITNQNNDVIGASHAGYVSGIMWVKGELAKIEEVLNK